MNPDGHGNNQPLASRSPQDQPDGRLHAPAEKTEQVARTQASQAYQQGPGAPYNQTQQPTYNWQQYHSAWQQYYQQYYQRYYANELASQRGQTGQDEAKPEAPSLREQTIVGSDHIEEPKTRFQQVRDDLLDKVRERTEKLQKSNHFIPIVSALIVGLLLLGIQFNRLLIAQIESFISPGSTVNTSDTIIVDPTSTADIGQDPRLIIPKLNIDVPVLYNITTVDEKVIQAGLEKGAVHYNLPGANSVPGQAGNMAILGHSSNDVFDPGNYKFAFLLLDRLQSGDLFYMNYQGKRFVYKVSDKKIIKPTDWQVLQQGNGKPTAILVTCTPAGTAINRLLIYADQISPDPSTASAAPANKQDANPAEIPGNSQTFFERIWNIFF